MPKNKYLPDDPNKPLTEHEKRFCANLFKLGFNATEAYLEAGYKCKRAAARVSASKKLTKANIQKELGRLAQAAAKARQMEVNDVYSLLSDIAQADITQFVEFGTEKQLLEEAQVDEEGKETEPAIYEYKTILKLRESAQVDGRLIHSIRVTADGSITFKLHDKGQALNMLGKHLAMFTENLRIQEGSSEAAYLELLKGMDNETLEKDAYDD